MKKNILYYIVGLLSVVALQASTPKKENKKVPTYGFFSLDGMRERALLRKNWQEIRKDSINKILHSVLKKEEENESKESEERNISKTEINNNNNSNENIPKEKKKKRKRIRVKEARQMKKAETKKDKIQDERYVRFLNLYIKPSNFNFKKLVKERNVSDQYKLNKISNDDFNEFCVDSIVYEMEKDEISDPLNKYYGYLENFDKNDKFNDLDKKDQEELQDMIYIYNRFNAFKKFLFVITKFRDYKNKKANSILKKYWQKTNYAIQFLYDDEFCYNVVYDYVLVLLTFMLGRNLSNNKVAQACSISYDLLNRKFAILYSIFYAISIYFAYVGMEVSKKDGYKYFGSYSNIMTGIIVFVVVNAILHLLAALKKSWRKEMKKTYKNIGSLLFIIFVISARILPIYVSCISFQFGLKFGLSALTTLILSVLIFILTAYIAIWPVKAQANKIIQRELYKKGVFDKVPHQGKEWSFLRILITGHVIIAISVYLYGKRPFFTWDDKSQIL